MAIGKALRFDVFTRDSFTCQYCGRKAPEVLLHADHIHPVSKGGVDDITNLITSCADCNLGKSNKVLGMPVAALKRQAQLEELQERREQLEMLLNWAESLSETSDYVAQRLAGHWEGKTNYSVTETGLSKLRAIAKNFSPDEIIAAMDTSINQYGEWERGSLTPASVSQAFSKIGGVAKVSKMPPSQKELFYIRGILRNRLNYLNEGQMWALMNEAVSIGVSTEHIKRAARDCCSWTNWRNRLTEMIEGGQRDEG